MTRNCFWCSGYVLGLSFSLSLLLVAIDGCKKDDKSPTAPSAASYPSVAGHWTGTSHEDYASAGKSYECSIDGSLTQATDTVVANWLFIFTAPPSGYQTQCVFVGKITTTGKISLVETNFTPLNWNGVGWEMSTLTAQLSANGDTITGGWTNAGMGGGVATFKVVKQ